MGDADPIAGRCCSAAAHIYPVILGRQSSLFCDRDWGSRGKGGGGARADIRFNAFFLCSLATAGLVGYLYGEVRSHSSRRQLQNELARPCQTITVLFITPFSVVRLPSDVHLNLRRRSRIWVTAVGTGTVAHRSRPVRLREGMMIFLLAFAVCPSPRSNYSFMTAVKLRRGLDLEDTVTAGNDCLPSGRWHRRLDGIHTCPFPLVTDGTPVEQRKARSELGLSLLATQHRKREIIPLLQHLV